MPHPRNPHKYISPDPLPKVRCPATLGHTCGGKIVSADPLVHAINRGKVRDHKVAPLREKRRHGSPVHDLTLCPGSGQVVTLDPDGHEQLAFDFTTLREPAEPRPAYQEPTLLQAVNEQAIEDH